MSRAEWPARVSVRPAPARLPTFSGHVEPSRHRLVGGQLGVTAAVMAPTSVSRRSGASDGLDQWPDTFQFGRHCSQPGTCSNFSASYLLRQTAQRIRNRRDARCSVRSSHSALASAKRPCERHKGDQITGRLVRHRCRRVVANADTGQRPAACRYDSNEWPASWTAISHISFVFILTAIQSPNTTGSRLAKYATSLTSSQKTCSRTP